MGKTTRTEPCPRCDKRFILRQVSLIFVILWLSLAACAQTNPIRQLIPDDARAVVLYFIASDCPISNRSVPEMLRVQHEFTSRNVAFYFVYPNVTETSGGIATHRAAFGLPSGLTDPGGRLGLLAGADTTPEAAILIPHGNTLKSIYAGRVDDRSLNLGTERPTATRHDLEDALAALVANRPISAPGGPPVGCYFVKAHP